MLTPILGRNLYDVLGIEKGASADDIRKAYRKRALETHPDKLDPKASEMQKQLAEKHFHKVHEAFEILGDNVSREKYDASLVSGADLSMISEEARRRIQERRNWAQLQREGHEKRLAEIKQKVEQEKREREAASVKLKKEAALVREMLQEMYKMTPELAARRQAVLQRKAEREHAEMLKHTTQRPIHS